MVVVGGGCWQSSVSVSRPLSCVAASSGIKLETSPPAVETPEPEEPLPPPVAPLPHAASLTLEATGSPNDYEFEYLLDTDCAGKGLEVRPLIRLSSCSRGGQTTLSRQILEASS